MAKRIAIYLIGMSVTSLGIALVVFSSVGAGPWDAVAAGLHKQLGLTIGMWSIISQGLVVLLIALIEKERLQYGAVIAIIIRSFFLDAWIYLVIRHIDLTYSMLTQWSSFMLGILLIGTGIGLYLEAKFPKTPIDGLMVALHHRFGWTLGGSRLLIEFTAALLGFLLGGPVGLGTMMVALFLGKIVQFTNGKIRSILNHQSTTYISVEESLRKNS
ncbi:YczE/YyaS/YitT family protein [Bacillus dakarensis]|uniref:YczE/YyaS/YitT family protein n=1 Tax=Robertmurraya dakarensis TaxID=1926278 RepID=UPI0009812674|nr:BCR, YitT family protein [Bacillus dakarensis]